MGRAKLVFLFVEKNMFLAFINYHRPQRLKAANATNKQTQTVNRNVNSNVQWHSCQVSQCLRRFRSNLGGKTKSLQAYGVLLTAWWSAFHPTNIVQDYLEINTNGHICMASAATSPILIWKPVSLESVLADAITIANSNSRTWRRNGLSLCVFFNWYPPKKLKYGKPRLGVSTLT